MRILLVLLIVLGAAPVRAQTSPVESARQAIEALNEAARELEAANKSRDRVAALTQTIHAYEIGLDAMREGLRRATIREAAIRGVFESQRDQLSRLLGAMSAIESAPAPASLLHPGGPLDAVRTSMIMAQLVPALQARADELRTLLEEVAALRQVQESAVRVLEDGLVGAETARVALSQAISERSDLPRRFYADPRNVQALANATETLDAFANGLAQLDWLPANSTPAINMAAPSDFSTQKGQLALPVLGQVIRNYLEADAAGIARPGLIVATRPRALVTLPMPATIRYAGPLTDYGNVVVAEPAEGVLLVLAGLGQVFNGSGDVLAAGAPVGLMPGDARDTQEVLIRTQQGNATSQTETLYIELRLDGSPVDPAEWFALGVQ